MNAPKDSAPPAALPERGVFSNRTLNLRSVQAIGYDMDYTLIHYRVDRWEGAAFEHARGHLRTLGWPVDDLSFDAERHTLGLVFDLALGNLVKATRFGYVVKANHGTAALDFDAQRSAYAETVIDLGLDRFEFMNTMFELSRADLWCQLVDLFDAGKLPGVRTYGDVYAAIDDALAESHLGGRLKAEILADPDRFIDLDPDMVPTLLEQRQAGKSLLLITNSDWAYTQPIMTYAFDRFCPDESTWRDLFDIVIVSAAKPSFFAKLNPIYRVVDERESLLHPHYGLLEPGHVYFGGNAAMVEASLGCSAAQVLYVGDHLFGDVHVTKDALRWRTALVARELEDEIAAATDFAADQLRLSALMSQKIAVDRRQAQLRLERDQQGGAAVAKQLDSITKNAIKLDEQIAPLARAAAQLGNPIWGPLMRAGSDKSLFARQVEKYADIYLSRPSNLRYETPYAYLRAARGSLPHDVASEML